MFDFFKRLSTYSLVDTIRFNFIVFPFHIAKDLPIKIGKNVTMIGLKKGCVELKTDKNTSYKKKKFISEIGTTRVPMMAPKGCHTLLRFGTESNTKLVLGRDDEIVSGCSIILTNNGVLELGNNVKINHKSLIYCSTSIKIGNNVRIGWQCQLYDSNFHFLFDVETSTIRTVFNRIELKNNVWLANRVTVGPGSILPSFAVVASNSLINKDFSDESNYGVLFAGSPAKPKGIRGKRIVNELFQWRLYKYFNDNQIYQTNEFIEEEWWYTQK